MHDGLSLRGRRAPGARIFTRSRSRVNYGSTGQTEAENTCVVWVTAGGSSGPLTRNLRRVARYPASDLVAEPHHRVVLAADHSLLEWYQRVVGDVDVLRADLGAALGDVAHAEAEIVLRDLAPVSGVSWVHLELGDPHQEARPGVCGHVLLVVTDHVAHVLAQEALDALAELLRPRDVHLLHAELAEPDRRIRRERRDLPRLLVIKRDVGDQVTDDREGPHRRHRDRVIRLEQRHPRHAGQPGAAVDLHRA